MRHRRLRGIGLGVVLLLVAAGCGDDEGGTTDTTSGGTTTGPSSEFEGLAFDESAQCGVDPYTGSFAKLEAVDEFTVKFTLCAPDVAFPAKVAFTSFGIYSEDQIESSGGGGDLVDAPIGTGPYALETWDRGTQIVWKKFADYWGEPAHSDTLVFKWSAEAAQRLVELQSGTVDGIDNVGTDDFQTVQGDSNLQLIERDALNVFYVGFNVDMPPFDNEKVRQAIAHAIDKDRIVNNFYPKGSEPAAQFLPPAIPGFVDNFTGNDFDVDAAKALMADAGFADGIDVKLSYRDVVRGYLPQPTPVATDLQDQLAKIGIRVTLDPQESTTFIDNANAGTLPFYLLGWGADYPDATNFLDYHFGKGASPQFGTGFSDIHGLLADASQTTDQDERNDLYSQVADLLAEHVPMVPVAYGGSAVAFKASVKGAFASPLTNEELALMDNGQDQIVFMQNAEPGGLYCADETDGESLRACEQMNEALLGYEPGGTEVQPRLAESYESNDDLTEWTFHLREGVKFHDGSSLDANDVVKSFRVQWDAADPLHKGRVGDFTYFSALFGGFLNPPPSD